MLRYLVPCLSLFACELEQSAKDVAESCQNNVLTSTPRDGESSYYGTTVEVRFGEVDENTSLTVSCDGVDVSGSTLWEDKTLVFTASAPLAPSSTCEFTIGQECGEVILSFTVSDRCDNSLVGTFPKDGETGVYYRSTVEATLPSLPPTPLRCT